VDLDMVVDACIHDTCKDAHPRIWADEFSPMWRSCDAALGSEFRGQKLREGIPAL
jgi:hypothetical protein